MGTESARKCRVEDAAEEQGGGTAQLQCQSGAHKNELRQKPFLVEVQARTFHQEASMKPVPNDIMQWK